MTNNIQTRDAITGNLSDRLDAAEAEVVRLQEQVKSLVAFKVAVEQLRHVLPVAAAEREDEIARLKQATARAYPDSVAQVVEGIKAYPPPTKGEVASDREALARRVRLAVNEWCSCGGRGPDDEDACSACHVLHMVFEEEG